MTTAPMHRDDHGRDRGRGAGEQAERDAGDGDVADAVAHQGEPALHEVGADGGRRQAGEQRAEQRPDHEVVGEQVHRPLVLSAASSGEATAGAWSLPGRPGRGSWWWSCGQVGVGERVDRRSVVRDAAVAHHQRPVDQRRRAGRARGRPARSWRRGRRGCAARRRTPAGWARRRRRSARRGPAGPGTPARARAISTRCCWPPDSVETPSRARSARPTAAIARLDGLAVGATRRHERPSARQPPRGRPPRGRRRARRTRR